MVSFLFPCIFRHREQWNAQFPNSQHTSDESDRAEGPDLRQLHWSVHFVHTHVLREHQWAWVERLSAAAKDGEENAGQLLHHECCFRGFVRRPAQHRVPQSQRAGQPAPGRHWRFQGEERVRGTKLSRRPVRLLTKPCKKLWKATEGGRSGAVSLLLRQRADGAEEASGLMVKGEYCSRSHMANFGID